MHDKTTTSPADEVVDRALYRELMDGWNQGSGDAFVAVFTEYGDVVAFDARTSKGVRRSHRSTRNFSTSP